MSDPRYLIVNADDFGMSAGINEGVIAAHERGILTSASLMVRWPAAVQAAAYARESKTLGVGLHLDLGDMIYTGGQWRSLYEVLPEGADEPMLRAEVARQIARFIELVGRAPAHIDTHQHRHRREPLRTILSEHCSKSGIPLRDLTPWIKHLGGFYGQDGRGDSYPECISVESLLGILDTLPAGVVELGCHPAARIDFQSTYLDERLLELTTLCDARVRRAIDDLSLRLVTFSEVTAAGGHGW